MCQYLLTFYVKINKHWGLLFNISSDGLRSVSLICADQSSQLRQNIMRWRFFSQQHESCVHTYITWRGFTRVYYSPAATVFVHLLVCLRLIPLDAPAAFYIYPHPSSHCEINVMQVAQQICTHSTHSLKNSVNPKWWSNHTSNHILLHKTWSCLPCR